MTKLYKTLFLVAFIFCTWASRAQSIDTVSVIRNIACAGDTITCSFKITSFASNTKFYYWLSDSGGSLGSKTKLDSISTSGSKTVLKVLTLPTSLNGTSYVLLIVDSAGTRKDTTSKFKVNPKPTASFTVNNGSQCFNQQSFVFTNSSTGTSTFHWSFGGGASDTSNTTSPTKNNYATSGSKSIQLIVMSSLGCMDTANTGLVVLSSPTASFTVNNNSQCFNQQSFVFTNSSTGTSTSHWSFGGGASDTSNTTSPTKNNYATAGSKNVQLIVMSNLGCKDSATQNILVHPKPTVSFAIDSSIKCINQQLYKFTNSSTITAPGTLTYLWNFGEGASDTSTQSSTNRSNYAVTGTKTVKLVVTSNFGCKDSLNQTLVVHPKPTVAYAIDSSIKCINQQSYKFTSSSSVPYGTLNYLWNFGEGTADTSSTQNPTKNNYTSTGSKTVKLVITSSFGCKDSLNKSLVVHPKPTGAYAIDSTIKCINQQSFKFTNSSTIPYGTLSYWWNFGEGVSDTSVSTNTTKNNYAATGTKTVKLIATSSFGCKDTVSKTLVVHPKPTVAYAIDSSIKCINQQSYKFTNSSTVPYGTLNYWWNFGEGTSDTSSTQNPTKNNYTSTGSKTVKLAITSSFGCKDSVNKSLVVHPKPTVAYAIDSGIKCINQQSFKFTNSSTVAYGTLSYWWNFGEGVSDTSVSTNTSKNKYATTGTKTVKLVATSSFGCKDTVSKTLVVHPKPTAAYAIDSSIKCINQQSYKFTNSSTVPYGTLSYWWNYGEGISDTGVSTNTSKSNYATTGTKTVKLVATSSFGCKDTVSKTLVVHPKPTTAYAIDSSIKCINLQLYKFTNSTAVPYGTLTYLWNFGGGSSDTNSLQNPTKNNYSATGTKTVKLVATSSFGCLDSVSKTLVVHPKPTADFKIDSFLKCINLNSYKFTDLSSNPPYGNITNYWWNLGAGVGDTFLTQNTTKTNYTSSGSKTIKFIVTTNFGCKDTATKNLVIHPKPIADFKIDSNAKCINKQSFIFSNYTTIQYGSLTYRWNFGEGNGDTSIASSYTKTNYSNAGAKTIQLIATSSFGCKDTIFKNLIVYPKPVVNIKSSNTPLCYSNNTNISLTSNISNDTFNWFRDNTSNISGTNSANKQDSFIKISVQNNTDTTQLTVFKIIPFSNSCIGDTLKHTFTIYPLPNIKSDLSGITRICSGDQSQTIKFTSTTRNLDSGSRTTTISGNIQGAPKGNSYTFAPSTLTNFDSTVGYIAYATTPWAHLCSGPVKYDTLFVMPRPQVVSQTPKLQTFCSGETSAAVLFRTQTTFANTYYTFTAISTKNTSSGFKPSGIIGFTKTLDKQTISNTGKRIDSIIYTVTPHYVFYHSGSIIDTCTGSPINYYIIVNPIPQLFSGGITPICDGDNTSSIPFTTDILDNGTFYIWKEKLNGITKTTGSASGVGTIPSFNLKNLQPSTDKVDYTVTAFFTFNGDTCEGETKTISQYVNPRPPIMNSKVIDTICSGAKSLDHLITTNILPIGSGSTYSWKLIYKSPFISTIPINADTTTTIPSQILVNSSTNDNDTASIVYEITPYYNNPNFKSLSTCEGTKSLYKINVNPLPPVPIIDSMVNGPVCRESKGHNFSVNADPTKKYNWWTVPKDTDIYSINGTNCVVNLPPNSDPSYQVFVRSTNKYICHADTFTVLNVDTNSVAPPISNVILLKNNILLCQNNQPICYQWGRDNKKSLKPEEINGAIYQRYIAGNNLDTINYYYWVITCDVTGKCKTKSYFNTLPSYISGIGKKEYLSGIELYPNPTEGKVVLSLNNMIDKSSPLIIELYDFCGQRISALQLKSGTESHELDLSSYSKGMYIVNIKCGNDNYVSKVIKN